MVITLCGSTRFKKEFEEVNKRLTLAGDVVLSVGVFGHSGDEITKEQKKRLDRVHRQKIDMSGAIYVINKNGYIGQSTRDEIEYARRTGKRIIYMEDNDGTNSK